MIKLEEKITSKNKDHILNSYSAGDPEHPFWFIYEYASKKRVLVEVDKETGKVIFLKELK